MVIMEKDTKKARICHIVSPLRLSTALTQYKPTAHTYTGANVYACYPE